MKASQSHQVSLGEMKKMSKKQTGKGRQKKQSIFAVGQHEKQEGREPEMPASVTNIPVSQSGDKKAGNQSNRVEPMELAKLAAILRPRSSPKAALKTAMQFYVEAVLFCRQYSSKTLQELLAEFGSEETQRSQRIAKLEHDYFRPMREDTLELDSKKDDDAVRQFLAERRLSLKTERGVLNNIREYWNQPLPKKVVFEEHGQEQTDTVSWAYQRSSFEEMIASCKHVGNDGKTTYELPKWLLERVANYAQRGRKEQKRRSFHTGKNREKPAQKTVKQKSQKTSV